MDHLPEIKYHMQAGTFSKSPTSGPSSGGSVHSNQSKKCLTRLLQTKRFTTEELNKRLETLNFYCHSTTSTLHGDEIIAKQKTIKKRRVSGLHLLKNIIHRTDPETININNLQAIVTCSIALNNYFFRRSQTIPTLSNYYFTQICHKFTNRTQRSNLSKSNKLIDQISVTFMPELSQAVINATLTYFNETKLWRNETLCGKIYQRYILDKKTSEKCVSALLTLSEQILLKDPATSKMIIRTLRNVLGEIDWSKLHISSLYRLLEMYRKSLTQKGKLNAAYIPLRSGLEVCIRSIMKSSPNMDLLIIIRIIITWTFEPDLQGENILDFGNLLEAAAIQHTAILLKDTLTIDLFPLILELISSKNHLHSLLGTRVLQHMIDRKGNRAHFTTPQIFHSDSIMKIIIPAYNSHDRTFMKHYRESLHDILFKSITMHGIHQSNLESVYTIIALLIVEIPCGFTVAAIVCLLMNIQAYTLENNSNPLSASHRFHATVLSLFTLICCVHKAEVLDTYVHGILTKRATVSPHLIPPLRNTYHYAIHHILWNKKELFFEDWEVRYGLWKCFRSRRIKGVVYD